MNDKDVDYACSVTRYESKHDRWLNFLYEGVLSVLVVLCIGYLFFMAICWAIQ